jgi:hypothetical protein
MQPFDVSLQRRAVWPTIDTHDGYQMACLQMACVRRASKTILTVCAQLYSTVRILTTPMDSNGSTHDVSMLAHSYKVVA